MRGAAIRSSDKGNLAMGKNRGRRVLLALCVSLLAAGTAWGQEEQPAPKIDPKADEVMHRLSDFYGGLQSLAFAVTVTMRVETEGMKQEMTTTQAIALRRPDRLAIRLVKGMMGATLVCDGQSVYTHLPFMKKYKVKKAPGALDALFQQPEALFVLGSTRSRLPLSTLLTSKPYQMLMEGVTAGDYVGMDEIEGAQYHHLKFYQEEIDWEIWVQAGEQPLVHKIVPDLSRQLAQARQITPDMGEMKMETTVRFENWAVNPDLPDALFVFTPPADAEKVESLFGEVEVEEAPAPEEKKAP